MLCSPSDLHPLDLTMRCVCVMPQGVCLPQVCCSFTSTSDGTIIQCESSLALTRWLLNETSVLFASICGNSSNVLAPYFCGVSTLHATPTFSTDCSRGVNPTDMQIGIIIGGVTGGFLGCFALCGCGRLVYKECLYNRHMAWLARKRDEYYAKERAKAALLSGT